MADLVDIFYNRTNGQVIGSCGGVTGQCVAASQNFANNELGISGCPAFPVEYAKDMMNSHASLDWIANTPTNFPPRGAIVVFNGNYGAGAGHTGIVTGANANTLDVFQQNDPYYSGMHIKTYNYNCVTGWGIAKTNQQEGTIMDTDAGKELYLTGLHRDAENEGVAGQWNGQTPAQALSGLRSSPEWKSTDAAIKSIAGLTASLEQQKTQVATLTTENEALKAQVVAQPADVTIPSEPTVEVPPTNPIVQLILYVINWIKQLINKGGK